MHQIRLHLLHGLDNGGQDNSAGGRQAPDTDDPRTGRKEPRLLGRNGGPRDRHQEDTLGEVHERRAGLRRAGLHAVHQAGAGEVRGHGEEGSDRSP